MEGSLYEWSERLMNEIYTPRITLRNAGAGLALKVTIIVLYMTVK